MQQDMQKYGLKKWNIETGHIHTDFIFFYTAYCTAAGNRHVAYTAFTGTDKQ
jgi:hypothetical protein